MKPTFKEELIMEIAETTNFDEQKVKTALTQVWMITPNVKIGVQGGGTIGEDIKVTGWKGRGAEKAWITIPTSWFCSSRQVVQRQWNQLSTHKNKNRIASLLNFCK